MFSVLFKIEPFSVYSFGVIQGFGILKAAIILYKEAKGNFNKFRVVACGDKLVTVIQKESF